MSASIENVQEFWNRRPCNIRHSQKTIGTKEYFDEVEEKRYNVEPHNKTFPQFEKWKDKEVLEIGCGIGTDTINFARAGAKVTAIDLSAASIELAKQRAGVFNLSDRVQFIQGSAEDMTSLLGDKKFDLIYSFGVIHHTPNPDGIFSKIKNHLKDNGEFRVMVYNKLSWRGFEILFESGNVFNNILDIDNAIARHSEAQQGCPVTFSYTSSQFKKILESHQLKVDDLSIYHIFPWVIKDYVKGNYEKKNIWKFIPDRIFNKLQSVIGWHLCVIAVKS